MKEICIDIRMAFHAGIGTYIRNLVSHLKKAPLRLRLLSPPSFIEKWPELKECDLIPIESPIYSIREQIELPIKIPRSDLFWSTHYNIPLGPIRAKKRLTSIHDVYHLAYRSTLEWKKRIYAKVMLEEAVRRSDHIVTISDFSKKEILRWTKAKENKISTIHLGVDSQKFTLTTEEKKLEEIKEYYGLPSSYILFVSSFAPHKNLARLIKAWLLVQLKHPNWKLVLVGKKTKDLSYQTILEDYPLLKAHVLELNHVAHEHLPLLYQLAKGSILPSLYEGFGLTPLEAMAMQCPTIVSNVASLPEVCGDAVLYVNPYDEKDIAQKICQLIEDPCLRKELTHRGRAHAQKYSWEKTAQAHLNIIETII